jgi:hypothetical protein
MGRQYRFSWRSVTCRYQFTAYGASRCYRRTISSLHIGHARRLLARAAAFSLGPSRTLLPMSSLVSAVLAGLLDVWLLSDRELSEGDSRLALRTWLCCACGACNVCVCGGADSSRSQARDRHPGTCGRPWWEKKSTWVRCLGVVQLAVGRAGVYGGAALEVGVAQGFLCMRIVRAGHCTPNEFLVECCSIPLSLDATNVINSSG